MITLPTFHLTAKSVDELAAGYFGSDRMKAHVNTVQREEIRRGISAIKHQHEVGSDLGDTCKEMVASDRALKEGGHANTMNQFAAAYPPRSGSQSPSPPNRVSRAGESSKTVVAEPIWTRQFRHPAGTSLILPTRHQAHSNEHRTETVTQFERPQQFIEYCPKPLALDEDTPAARQTVRRLLHVIKTLSVTIAADFA